MNLSTTTTQGAHCPRCGAVNQCQALTGDAQHCWCRQLPALPAPDWQGSCYCPACLRLLATTPAEPTERK